MDTASYVLWHSNGEKKTKMYTLRRHSCEKTCVGCLSSSWARKQHTWAERWWGIPLIRIHLGYHEMSRNEKKKKKKAFESCDSSPSARQWKVKSLPFWVHNHVYFTFKIRSLQQSRVRGGRSALVSDKELWLLVWTARPSGPRCIFADYKWFSLGVSVSELPSAFITLPFLPSASLPVWVFVACLAVKTNRNFF